MQCVADCQTKQPKLFEQPVLQTLQMFVGESGCWLVVLISFLLRQFSKTPKTSANGDVSYQRVATEDISTEEEDEDEGVGDLESSQTLVDPTNVVAKPLVEAELAIERKPLTGWKVFLLGNDVDECWASLCRGLDLPNDSRSIGTLCWSLQRAVSQTTSWILEVG